MRVERGGVTEQQPLAVPQVIIDKSLLSETVPYRVGVEQANCASLLRSMGMEEDKIASLQIVLQRKESDRFLGSLLGSYNPKDHRITIATERMWNAARNSFYYGQALLNEERSKLPKEAIFGTEDLDRLIHQYKHIPKGVFIVYLRESIEEGTNSLLGSVFAHEAYHAVDTGDLTYDIDAAKNYKRKLNYVSTALAPLNIGGVFLVNKVPSDFSDLAVAGILAIDILTGALLQRERKKATRRVYESSSYEQRANAFAESQFDNLRHNQFITLKPKLPPVRT